MPACFLTTFQNRSLQSNGKSIWKMRSFGCKRECMYIWYSLRDSRRRHRASKWRIVSVNFHAIYRSRKNGEQDETVEGNAKHFSGCRQQIPRSSQRNPHSEKLWQPSLARTITYDPYLVPFTVIFRFCHFLRLFVSSHHSFEPLFKCISILLLPLYIPRDILVHLQHPSVVRGRCRINKAASSRKTINPKWRASNLLNGKRKGASRRTQKEDSGEKQVEVRERATCKKSKEQAESTWDVFKIVIYNLGRWVSRNFSNKWCYGNNLCFIYVYIEIMDFGLLLIKFEKFTRAHKYISINEKYERICIFIRLIWYQYLYLSKAMGLLEWTHMLCVSPS